ncbi:MAG: ATP-dependent zinc metalloprotease FtsH [Candidatus Obscuribacterales bacterium]|nr:ATP-dependent zinc metalloprotease FtsH [Candidatus Obscuribacterales bacterium]
MKPTVEDVPNLQQSILYLLLGFWLSFLILGFVSSASTLNLPYSSFIKEAQEGKISDVKIGRELIVGSLQTGEKRAQFRTVRVEDPDLANRLSQQKVKFQGETEDTFFKNVLSWLLPAFVIFGLIMFLVERVGGKNAGGPGLLSIEKNRAKIFMESNVKTTFEDIAGVDEAKDELKEIIGFLKEPERFGRLGGHVPKGILLVGPPGTGKTLLARAVAGEAGVSFFSISGSEFVEMFVGVGAARVRDLFAQAQRHAPCIIFIDELDALGRARGLNAAGGGHDEKEQTLNQLLVEMDGFDPRQGVILLAATNRPEILDAALLRAGRFDRHVVVDRPDRLGRQQILSVHLRKVTFDQSVDTNRIASDTAGFTGADLANLVNEAVLAATRRGADAVGPEDFEVALERIVAGLEKRNRLLNLKERRVVAHHEMGHAIVSMSLPGTDPVQKVSIIPRGFGALGYTIQRPTEDRYLMSREELENKLAVLLGGRAAEMLVFEDVSTGAADDLSKATDIARNMVTRYGMAKTLGTVAYDCDPQPYLNGYRVPSAERRTFSEETAREIDCAVRDLLQKALERAMAILEERRSELDDTANLLLSKETLTAEDLASIRSAKSGAHNRLREFV